jgi:hypothetical protein
MTKGIACFNFPHFYEYYHFGCGMGQRRTEIKIGTNASRSSVEINKARY